MSRNHDWGVTFDGPGILVHGVADVRPTAVHARLTPRGGRSTLAEILRDPRSRVMPDLHVCEHAPGDRSAARAHRTVRLASSRH